MAESEKKLGAIKYTEERVKLIGEFAEQTSWPSQKYEKLSVKGDIFKRDEIDVESLWQLQPDLKN